MIMSLTDRFFETQLGEFTLDPLTPEWLIKTFCVLVSLVLLLVASVVIVGAVFLIGKAPAHFLGFFGGALVLWFGSKVHTEWVAFKKRNEDVE